MPTVANKPEIRQQSRFRRELLPNARAFYERELGELGRPDRKWWAAPKAGCPRHNSKSKSSFAVNLIHGGWRCFGCNVRGDMPRFVQWRYGLKFWDAAKYLNAIDGDVTPAHLAAVESQRQKEQLQRAGEEEKVAEIRGRRLLARAWLHGLEKHYRSESARLSGLHGEQSDAAETAWANLAMLHVEIAEADAEYCELAGLEFSR